MFYLCNVATGVENAQFLDVSNVTEMNSMFYDFGGYADPTVPDVGDWDTSKVTDMSSMFWCFGEHSTGLNAVPDVSKWNTANVTNMFRVFQDYAAESTTLNVVPDVSNWNMSAVTNVNSMFFNYGRTSAVLNFSLDLSKWDVSSISNCSSIFGRDTSRGVACAGWTVIIPEKTGETLNTGSSWYIGDGTSTGNYIYPQSGRAFTICTSD